MAKSIKTHLFCFDDRRAFTEDILKKFPDVSRYTVLSFATQDEFMNQLNTGKENKFCKIAIIGVHDNKDEYSETGRFAMDIKKSDHRTGIILLCPPDKTEEIRNSVKFNIDACVPQNSNSIPRIHNVVKKLISEHNINILRKRRNISIAVLLAFIMLSALFLIFARYLFPGSF